MQLGAQLYTLREYTKTERDFDNTLGLCHEIGYPGVQLSAVGCMNGDAPEVTARRAREMLDSHGLICAATHRPLEALQNRLDEEIEFHQTLGCDYIAIGGIWPTDYAEFNRFVEDVRPIVSRLKAHGIRFGYHNHSHEFARNAASGRPWFDVLIDDGGADLMLEVDTYWVAHAGIDPARLLARCAGRIPVIHVKDMEVVPGSGPDYAPIGEGNLDWDSILSAASQGGTEWLLVEQDTCRRDPFDCLRASYTFLVDRIEAGG